MDEKLIIRREEKRIMTYYLQEDRLVSVQVEQEDVSLLQNIYIAKVKDVVKNLNAAFVEIQNGVRCYLPLSDCKSPIFCTPHVSEKHTLVAGDELVVQVNKDAIKTKEASVTTALSLAGKYAVVSYPNTKIGFSNKLSSYEKEQLKECIAPYLEEGLGYVIRTNAAVFVSKGKKEQPVETQNDIEDVGSTSLTEVENKELLYQELQSLSAKMKQIIAIAPTRTTFSLLYQSPAKYINSIKNFSGKQLSKIITDDATLFQDIKEYITQNQPEDLEKLSLYQDEVLPLHKLYRLESMLEQALQKKVWLKSGGYLIIEPTEALTVIDVNSGKNTMKKENSALVFQTNKEAAIEIARQIRLRNLSGIIVIDFISMKKKTDNESLLRLLKEQVKKDSVKTDVIDMTPLGLIEVTRKKVEAPLHEQLRNK